MVKGFPWGWVNIQRNSARWLGAGLAILWLTTTLGMAAERPVILVMGDSISTAYGIEREAGWVTLLEERLDGSAQLVNASISGETRACGRRRLPTLPLHAAHAPLQARS